MESNYSPEKRKYKRYRVNRLEVKNGDSGEKLGYIVNLSLGGMLITHNTNWEMNTVLPIRVLLSQSGAELDDFVADVRFRWFSQNDQSGLFGFGLEFLQNTPEQQSKIKHIIEAFSQDGE